MAGPSLSGPLGGWTSGSLAPKTVPAAASDVNTGYSVQKSYVSTAARDADYAATKKLAADAVAKGADPKWFDSVTGGPLNVAAAKLIYPNFGQESGTGSAQNPLATGTSADEQAKLLAASLKARENATSAPTDTLTKQILQFGNAGSGPSISGPSQVVPGIPAPVPIAAPAPASFSLPSSTGSTAAYDLKDSDFGAALDPSQGPPTTPLERLLQSIYPDYATGDGADPFTDPRTPGGGNSVLNNVLAGIGANRSPASGFVQPSGPAFSGPAVGQNVGANLAATIPGAPPFLANAINGVQGFNPYAQPQPTMVGGGVGGGFDPLIGISAISAEQRVQAAQLAKDKAAAQAKWFKAQADIEQQNAQKANISRLQGFGNPIGVASGGWTPAMPQF